jgi:hypothetical protein
MVKYVFAEDHLVAIKGAKKANPQVIGEALAKITADAGGKLTPHAVVNAARSDRHPLHRHFEWDDAVAAEHFRLDQARSIIRVVRIEDSDAPEGTVRAFMSVASGGVSYRSAGEVKGSQHLQAVVLQQAHRDLEAFEKRYRELTEVCDLVRAAKEAVSRRRAKTESRAAA